MDFYDVSDAIYAASAPSDEPIIAIAPIGDSGSTKNDIANVVENEGSSSVIRLTV